MAYAAALGEDRRPSTSTPLGRGRRPRPSAVPGLLRVAARRRRCAPWRSPDEHRGAQRPRDPPISSSTGRPRGRPPAHHRHRRRRRRPPPGALWSLRFETVDTPAAARSPRPTTAPSIAASACDPGSPSPSGRRAATGEARGRKVRGRSRREAATPATTWSDRGPDLRPRLAHVYTECARIWNPIHTDRAVARAAGLPDIILHGTATLALAVSRSLAREPAARRAGARAGSAAASRGMVPLPSRLTVGWRPGGADAAAAGPTAASGRSSRRARRARGRRPTCWSTREHVSDPMTKLERIQAAHQAPAHRPAAVRRSGATSPTSTARRPRWRSPRCGSTSATARTSSRSRRPAATRSRTGAASRATRSCPTATAAARATPSTPPRTGRRSAP